MLTTHLLFLPSVIQLPKYKPSSNSFPSHNPSILFDSAYIIFSLRAGIFIEFSPKNLIFLFSITTSFVHILLHIF